MPLRLAGQRVALAGDGQIMAGGQVLVRRLPWGQKLAYVPKGPLVDWRKPPQVRSLMEGLRQVALAHRAALLKLEPDLLNSPLLDLQLQSYSLRRGHPVQPRSTIHLDLSGGAEAVLAGMKQKWRYNVRLAERKGVVVRPMAAADFPAFLAMNAETGQRDGFGIHDAAYYETAFELFPPDQARWLMAEAEGQPLAAIVVFALGQKSWYMWGASNSLERHRMPNHALQWAGLTWACERGCRSYDLWGIPDEVGAKPERWSEILLSNRAGCGACIVSSKALAAKLCGTRGRGTYPARGRLSALLRRSTAAAAILIDLSIGGATWQTPDGHFLGMKIGPLISRIWLSMVIQMQALQSNNVRLLRFVAL